MKAVFLDRDGIINESLIKNGMPFAPLNADDCRIIEGVAVALKQLKALGYALVVITNQPDVARGVARAEDVASVNAKIAKDIPEIDEFRICFHTDTDNCLCRKPKPGMLIEAACALHIDLEKSFMVGDRWRDVDAGKAAGCKTLFVNYKYKESLKEKPDHIFSSSADALNWIIQNS